MSINTVRQNHPYASPELFKTAMEIADLTYITVSYRSVRTDGNELNKREDLLELVVELLKEKL